MTFLDWWKWKFGKKVRGYMAARDAWDYSWNSAIEEAAKVCESGCDLDSDEELGDGCHRSDAVAIRSLAHPVPDKQ